MYVERQFLSFCLDAHVNALSVSMKWPLLMAFPIVFFRREQLSVAVAVNQLMTSQRTRATACPDFRTLSGPNSYRNQNMYCRSNNFQRYKIYNFRPAYMRREISSVQTTYPDLGIIITPMGKAKTWLMFGGHCAYIYVYILSLNHVVIFNTLVCTCNCCLLRFSGLSDPRSFCC
jgi:hypothetical protein